MSLRHITGSREQVYRAALSARGRCNPIWLIDGKQFASRPCIFFLADNVSFLGVRTQRAYFFLNTCSHGILNATFYCG